MTIKSKMGEHAGTLACLMVVLKPAEVAGASTLAE